MKCVICHGDDIRTTEVKEEFRIGSDIVCVPIRTPVCHSCGEKYYDRRTMRFLEEVEQNLKQGKTNLEEVGRVLQVAAGQ